MSGSPVLPLASGSACHEHDPFFASGCGHFDWTGLSGNPIVVSGQLPSSVMRSGYIASGAISPLNLVSGVLLCSRCQVSIAREYRVIVYNNGFGKALEGRYCVACASFDPVKGDFYRREDWIKEFYPNCSGYPNYALADCLEEDGRYIDANYIRNLKEPGS